MHAISLEGVSCTFPARGGQGAYTAMRDVNLQVAAGEFVSIVGPTGCGKSTLLNVAAGLLAPSAGVARGGLGFRSTNTVPVLPVEPLPEPMKDTTLATSGSDCTIELSAS